MLSSIAQDILLKWITLVSIFIHIVLCAPFSPDPKNDLFYEPETGFGNTKPGTVLKSRVLPIKSLSPFFSSRQNIQSVYQFLYRSTDSLDNPTATVTTLLVPVNADPDKLLSYQFYEDSSGSDCAPSYMLLKGTSFLNLISELEILFINTMLSRGYYVVVPDYEGPGSFFGVGKNSGQGVLDSIRAVLSSGKQTQLRADAQVQLYGYSGGAFATGWAVQIQASYAPELKVIGAAFGGIPVNLKSTLGVVNKSPSSGVIPSGIHGMSAQYPELAAYIDSVLKPEKKQTFMAAKNSCLGPLIIQFAFQNVEDYFTSRDYLSHPIVAKVLEENSLGKEGTPKIPLFMYQAIHDEVTPFADVEALYDTWCSSADNETSIEFVRDRLSDHTILMPTGAANAIHFLIDGFNNRTRKPGCSKRTTITSALDPGSIAIIGKLIFDNLNGLLRGLIRDGSIL